MEIQKIVLDSSELSNYLFELNSNYFDSVYAENYDDYVSNIRKKINTEQKICWSYKVKVVGDDHDYWHYILRENKFLKLSSDAAKISLKAWKIENQIGHLKEKEKELKSNLDQLLENI